MPYKNPFFNLQNQNALVPQNQHDRITPQELLTLLTNLDLLAGLNHFLNLNDDNHLVAALENPNRQGVLTNLKLIYNQQLAPPLNIMNHRLRFNFLLDSYHSTGVIQGPPYNQADVLYAYIFSLVFLRISGQAGNLFEKATILIAGQYQAQDMEDAALNRWENMFNTHIYQPQMQNTLLIRLGLLNEQAEEIGGVLANDLTV